MDINTELLMISRQLTPEHKIELLSMVNDAKDTEDSGNRSLTDKAIENINSLIQSQEYSCININSKE